VLEYFKKIIVVIVLKKIKAISQLNNNVYLTTLLLQFFFLAFRLSFVEICTTVTLMIKSILRYFAIIGIYNVICLNAFSQKKYTAADSLNIHNLIAQSQAFTKESKYGSATAYAKQVLNYAKLVDYKTGEGYAYDCLAEVKLLNGEMNEVRYYDSLELPLAVSVKDTTLMVSSYNRKGIYFMETGNNKAAEQSFLTAINMGLDKQQSSKTAEVYSNLGSLYLSLGNKDKAIDWFFKSLRLYEKNNNLSGQGETYSNISSVYYLMHRIDDAIDFQKKSIELREKTKDLPGLVITNVNIGQLYILKGVYPQALQYLQQSVHTAEQINNAKLKASAYSGMAAYYSRTKDFASALKWQQKAITLFEETNNVQLLSRLYVAAGNLANTTGDSLVALNYYTKALHLANSLNNKENISNAYDKLSSFYQSHADYEKAYQNYKRYIDYRDSISSFSTLAKIEEIKTKYETEKKDNEIAKLNIEQRIRQLEIEKQKAIISGNVLEAKQKENEIKLLSQDKQLQEAKFGKQSEVLDKQLLIAKNNEQELKLAAQDKQLKVKQIENQKQFRNLLIGGIATLFILAGFLFNRYQLRKKLEQQKLLLEMRNDISRNLHDDIGASLSNINILNELTKRNVANPEKANIYLSKAGDDIQRISESLSDIVWNINPQYDDLDNLYVRMKRYAADMLDGKNIDADFSFPSDSVNITMPMDQRRDFYLIFKEAVNNLVKYSKATAATITINATEQNIHLLVKDNGQGFDVANARQGNGLQNIKQRADKWKANLNLQSAEGKGTTIELRMKIAT
jgi:signal transduction histidine kinase